MYSFGSTSQKRLDTTHQDIQATCNEVIQYIDFSILEGTRTLEKQQEYFRDKKSKLDGINQKSKHQSLPSLAVDVAPYPIEWEGDKSRARFYLLAGYFFMASEMLFEAGEITHKIRWGGDWNSNKDFSDQSFDDLPHFELV